MNDENRKDLSENGKKITRSFGELRVLVPVNGVTDDDAARAAEFWEPAHDKKTKHKDVEAAKRWASEKKLERFRIIRHIGEYKPKVKTTLEKVD